MQDPISVEFPYLEKNMKKLSIPWRTELKRFNKEKQHVKKPKTSAKQTQIWAHFYEKAENGNQGVPAGDGGATYRTSVSALYPSFFL